MEVNQLGTADRTEVGSLVSGLNAVCGRRGSGKSSLLRWLRSMIQPTLSCENGPVGLEQASGRLTLLVGDSEYQLDRHRRDGKPAGKLLRRTSAAWNSNIWNTSAWNGGGETYLDQPNSSETISSLQREAFDRLAAVPSDTFACDRLRDAARHLQLDVTDKPGVGDERTRLEVREQELVRELHATDGLTANREGLQSKRRQLEAEFERLRRESDGFRNSTDTDEHHRLSDRLAAIERDGQRIRDEIAQFDAELVQIRGGHASIHDPQPGHVQHLSYRERLLALDAQLARWRNTLNEIRSHRERLESCATDAHLDGQLGEQFSPINHATPRLALRSLEAQIAEARRHFDAMLEGVQSYRVDFDQARNELPQTLRLMQRELHEVCQQLSRHESLSAGRAMKDQILQLARCEAEMRQAIERLIVERGELLRAIATACQLSIDEVSVAYSDSCRCADHPHLDAWLTAISSGPAGHDHQHVPGVSQWRLDELSQLEAKRAHALSRLDDNRRDYRETETRLRRLGVIPVPAVRNERLDADAVRELDQVKADLQRLETRDRLRVELSDVRRQLQLLPRHAVGDGSLQERFLRHLAGLTGSSDQVSSYPVTLNGHGFDGIHGSYGLQSYGVVSRSGSRAFSGIHSAASPGGMNGARLERLHEVALRLAIVEALASRRNSIPLILDETLDGLDGPQRLTVIRYLVGIAEATRLQIIVLTDDEGLVESIRAARGNIVPIIVSRAIEKPEPARENDVNRQLLGFANDFELEKWGEPVPVAKPTIRREPKYRLVLTERSDVEQVPSIGPVIAERLRALGVHKVRDLLDVESEWLADNARLDGVVSTVVNVWKSEARLLIGMPQLRAFDARVLAGAGVRDPKHLSETHPSRLHERVERFLATDRGRQIMRGGSSQELSRINAWINSTKRDRSGRLTPSYRTESSEPGFDLNSTRSRFPRSSSGKTRNSDDALPTYQIVERDEQEGGFPQERQSREGRARRKSKQIRRERTSAPSEQNGARWRFYLELSSPVVDAPSIGDTMAERLATLGIHKIEDLVAANPEKVASDLNLPKLTAETVRAWQEQTRLVLRIPNLRGHDAQILVACGITSPEALTRMEPQALLNQALAVARSGQIPRGLRSNQVPDLDEVTDWIQWSSHSRALLAA